MVKLITAIYAIKTLALCTRNIMQAAIPLVNIDKSKIRSSIVIKIQLDSSETKLKSNDTKLQNKLAYR